MEFMTVEEIKAQLDYTLQNTVKQTINNYVKVVKFDPMIQGRFKKNLFSEMIDVTGNVEWHRDSVSITDVDLTNTLIYVDRVYGLTNEKRTEIDNVYLRALLTLWIFCHLIELVIDVLSLFYAMEHKRNVMFLKMRMHQENILLKHCRDTTLRTYTIQYNRLREDLGWRKLSNLNLVILQDAFNKLSSDKSRSDCKAVLVDMLNRAMESELLNRNPALGIKTILDNTEKVEKRILSEEETTILLDTAKDGMLYPILVVALNTGMRMVELLGLTWECIDFEKKVVRVEKTLTYLPGDGTHANYEFHAPKTKAGKRTIPMTKSVYEVLLIQKDRCNNINTHFSPKPGFEDLVFISKTNHPINASNMKDSRY